MTSRMRVAGLILTAGALMALPLLSTLSALADDASAGKDSGSKVDSTAYPKSPSGTPAADDKGKPVEAKGDSTAKPDSASKAGTEGAPASTATPSTAYPGAPTNAPAAGDGGKPVKP